jgi:DNA-directed RNA polymerase subunit omega
MARVTIEDCLHTVENRFALVKLAALRTKQIMQGAPSFIQKKKNKPIVMSLREIAKGFVKPEKRPEY